MAGIVDTVSGGHSSGHRVHGPLIVFLFARQKVIGQDLSCLVTFGRLLFCPGQQIVYVVFVRSLCSHRRQRRSHIL